MIRHIRVKQNRSKLPFQELDRRGMSYLFCEVGNKRGFIVGRPGIIASISNQKMIDVTVIEEKKYRPVDMYIRFQTGRMGQTYTDMSTYRGRIIGATQSMQPHYVWEIL